VSNFIIGGGHIKKQIIISVNIVDKFGTPAKSSILDRSKVYSTTMYF